MKYTMSPEKARIILREAAAARAKWGKQAAPPYTLLQLMEAVERGQQMEDERIAELTREIVRLKRQLGMARTREIGLKKKLGMNVTEDLSDIEDAVSQ